MDNGPGPVVILIFVIIGAVIIASILYSRKKRREFMEWAARRGYRVDESYDSRMEDRFPELRCLREGDDRYAYDTLTGQYEGRPFLGFHYHYSTTSTNSKGETETHHHHFSVAAIHSEVPLKPLFIRPEGLFDKVAAFFGKEDINFESAEFSRKFYVSADDRRWAYDVIHTRTMEYLLQAPSFTFQMTPEYLMAYRSSTFDPEQYDTAAQVIHELLNLLPEYVKQQQLGQVESIINPVSQ